MKLTLKKPLPLEYIGLIQAGRTVGWPNPAEEETHDTIDFGDLFLGQMDINAAKIFRAKGDSLIENGIYEHDILLVECTDKYKLGNLVIAEIDGDEMVKYIQKDSKGKFYLQAANKNMGPIYPSHHLKIKAVVRSIHRPLL